MGADHDHGPTAMPSVEGSAENATLAAVDDCAALVEGYYDLPLHIASIFIIMGVSVMGTLLPFVFKRFMSAKNGIFLQNLLKVFGAGIIISTATIHMLPPAAEALMSSCVGDQVHAYHGLFGALVLIGILSTHLAQVVLTDAISAKEGSGHHHHHHAHEDHCLADHQSSASNHGERAVDAVVVVPPAKESAPAVSKQHSFSSSSTMAATSDSSSSPGNVIALILLELGIAIHSVIIGVTLGTATDEFKTLLIAISFHQFFEGMALASVLLSSRTNDTKRNLGKSVSMVVFYGLSTSVGIAIGVGLHETFAPSARSSLLSQGILESISGGILLYEGLVNIITPHFLSKGYRASSRASKVTQVGMIWLGCAVMAIIGIWA